MKSRDIVQILLTALYFTGHLLSAFYRLFYKIANLWDVDLKIEVFIFDVNMDNPAKFCGQRADDHRFLAEHAADIWRI